MNNRQRHYLSLRFEVRPRQYMADGSLSGVGFAPRRCRSLNEAIEFAERYRASPEDGQVFEVVIADLRRDKADEVVWRMGREQAVMSV